MAAGDVVPQGGTDPVTLSGVIAETTSTLFKTTTTEPPSTTTTGAPTTTADDGPDLHETAYTTTTTVPTTAAPATTAPTTAAPTTAAPTTVAPTTTAAPSTTAAPTTTAAPSTTASRSSSPVCPASEDNDGYAYEDPRGTQAWCDLAMCESGQRWSINTGNGYYGGLQFSLESWQSVGGSGYPHQHADREQVHRGRLLQARQGWGAWPACSAELGLT